MNGEAKWFVVHTYSGYEKMVVEKIKTIIEAGSLGDLVKDAIVPTEKVKELRNGKFRDVEKKLFPGYVIVKMVFNNETWFAIKNVKGVTGFVGDPHNPNSLSQSEIDKLGIEKHTVKVDYKVGDVVNIVSGAFEGFNGKVEEIDEEASKVRVVVSVFGRNTLIEVDLEKVVLKD